MDAVTAVSGSGPAYFALLAEAMIEAGILLGLSREVTTQLVVQTMLGTAHLLRDEGIHPVELREQVTSPGGTTIRAIRELERAGVRAAFLNAIQAAMERSRELAAGRRMTLYGVELSLCSDAEEVASVVADELVAGARSGKSLALTGGALRGRAYELAAEREPDWSAASLWWGDERCVPPDDERSNFLPRAREPARPDRGRRQRRCTGSAASSAPKPRRDEYDELVRGRELRLRPARDRARRAHRVALPAQPTLDERERRAIPAAAKLEPFVERVTLTVPVLASAPEVVFIVTGEEKADAVERAFGRPSGPETPSSLIRSAEGRTRVVADRSRRLAIVSPRQQPDDGVYSGMAATESKPILDVLTLDKPEQLKALGHPLRLRVLETLGAADTEHMTNRELAGRARRRPRAPPLPRPHAPAGGPDRAGRGGPGTREALPRRRAHRAGGARAAESDATSDLRAAMLDEVQRGWAEHGTSGHFRSAQVTARITPEQAVELIQELAERAREARGPVVERRS